MNAQPSVTVKATYKGSTKTIVFQSQFAGDHQGRPQAAEAEGGNVIRLKNLGPDGWPEYEVVQEQLRAAFKLPQSEHPHWWHVYFAPNDGPWQCKFRRHVCSSTEFKEALDSLRQTQAPFPEPSLIFQVLLSNDPRLSTAKKYHSSIAAIAARQVLLDSRLKARGQVSHLSVILSALREKLAACLDTDDETARQFWQERIQEKADEFSELQAQLTAAEEDIKRFDKQNPIHRHTIEKETNRANDAKADFQKFYAHWLKVQGTSPAQSELDQNASQPKGTSTSAAPADFDAFLDDLESKGKQEQTGKSASSATFPDLDSVFRGSPESGSAATAQDARQTRPGTVRDVTDRFRDIVMSPNAGQAITTEFRSVLDGFLINLGSQFSDFEHGFKERHGALSDAYKTFQSGARNRSNSTQVSRAGADDSGTRMPGSFEHQTNAQGNHPGPSPAPAQNPQPAAPAPAAEPSAYLHVYKICDSCGEHPDIVNYKCDTCPDFDLCMKCLPRTTDQGFHNRDHRFFALMHPELSSKVIANSQSPRQETAVEHLAICDLCNMNVIGTRYKCLDCPDWDSCESCAQNLKTRHRGHNFIRLDNPDAIIFNRDERPTRHSGVYCDDCQQPIRGNRYKCVDPACPDFDLCEACESSPSRKHPRNHHMLKMRVAGFIENHSFYERGPHHPRHPGGHPHGQRQAFPPIFGGPRGSSHHHRHGHFGRHQPPSPPVPNQSGTKSADTFSLPRSSREAEKPSTVQNPLHAGANDIRTHLREAATQMREEIKKFQADLHENMQRSTGSPTSAAGPSAHRDAIPEEKVDLPENSSAASGSITEPKEQQEAAFVRPQESSKPDVEPKTMDAEFVEDVTVPDGFPLPANAEVMKIWKFRNSGNVVIPPETRLTWKDGEAFGLPESARSKAIGHEVQPGADFYLSVMNLKVPDKIGQSVQGCWQLVNCDGQAFGDQMWTQITVVEPEQSLDSSSIIIMPSPESSMTAGSVKTQSNRIVEASSGSQMAGPSVTQQADGRSVSSILSIENLISASEIDGDTDDGLDLLDDASRHSESDFEMITDSEAE